MAAVEDVTANLPSLQFEAALTHQEKYALFRKTACYFLKTLFELVDLIFFVGSCCTCGGGVML